MDQKPNSNNSKEELKKGDPQKERSDLNLEEMGADQYDYGTGGPGAGRDDSSGRSADSTAKTPESDESENLD